MSSDMPGLVLLSLLAIGAGLLARHVLPRVWRDHCPGIGTTGKIVSIVMLLAGASIGADKRPPSLRHIASLVTALKSEKLIDPSGRIGTLATVAASAEVTAAAADIIEAASNVVANAQARFDDAAAALTNSSVSVAYIAADMPRALPGIYTNHNIAATITRMEQIGETNLVLYVWYTQAPAIVPIVAFFCSVLPDTWTLMTPITNSFPDTVEIDGVPCVRYVCDIPQPIRGTVLRPENELRFGAPDMPLIVPAGGLLVETNNTTFLPYTGIDVYSPALSVRYEGGVAISATWHGTNLTGAGMAP